MSVRRNERGAWSVDIVFEHADGSKERVRKTSPVQTRKGAEEYERQIRQSLLDGTHGTKEAPSLAEFWPRFIDGYAKANRQKPSTITSKESIFESHLAPLLGEKRLDRITAEDVQALKTRLADHAPKTVNNVLTVLSKLLHVAVEWGELTRAPCSIDLVSGAAPVMKFYGFPEYERLVEAAAKLGPRTHAFVLLGGEAGLRSGEILAAEWPDVDAGRRIITVNRSEWQGHVTTPKGGRTRPVPMTERLAKALQVLRHLRGPRVLYRDDGKSFTRASLHERMKRAQRRAGLEETGGLHILRHTFCSHLAMLGAPPKAIQELAGHVTMATTMRYMHLSPNTLTAAIGLLGPRGNLTATPKGEEERK